MADRLRKNAEMRRMKNRIKTKYPKCTTMRTKWIKGKVVLFMRWNVVISKQEWTEHPPLTITSRSVLEAIE